MNPTITAFAQSPDRGQGLARDMPVRWALEEVGELYNVDRLTFAELKQPAHLARQPFGQIPTYQKADLTLFESGAIVFHLAEHHTELLPENANARARAITWMFAAVSTLEPPIMDLSLAKLLDQEKPWYTDRLPILEDRVRQRLAQLATHLAGGTWLENEFTAGDLLTVSVLRRLKRSGLLGEFPTLAAYVARGEARPAFQRAFSAGQQPA